MSQYSDTSITSPWCNVFQRDQQRLGSGGREHWTLNTVMHSMLWVFSSMSINLSPDLKLTGASATFTAFTLLPDLHKQEECKEFRVIGNCSPKFLFSKTSTLFCTGPTLQKRRQYCPSPRFPKWNVCIAGLGSKAGRQLTDICLISGWLPDSWIIKLFLYVLPFEEPTCLTDFYFLLFSLCFFLFFFSSAQPSKKMVRVKRQSRWDG